MTTRDTQQAAVTLTLAAGSHYTPINFFKDYSVEGNKLVLRSTVSTVLLIRAARRRDPALETEFAVQARTVEDVVTPASWAVNGVLVVALTAGTARSITLGGYVDLVYVASEQAAVVSVSLVSSASRERPWVSYPVESAFSGRLHPIASLTRHYDTGAQVIISPGTWTDNATTPTYFRTNQCLQGAICYVSGFSDIGVNLSRRAYGSVTLRPNIIACRKARSQDELWASTDWTYGIQPSTDGATPLYSNLDGGPWYVQWVTTHAASDPFGTHAIDSAEQAGDPGSTEPFLGCDFTGYVTRGNGTFHTINWVRPRKLIAAFEDSNFEGRVSPDGVTETVTIMEPRNWLATGNPVITPFEWDKRGALAQWSWLMISQWSQTNGYIPILLNRSFGGMWHAKIGAARRAALAAGWPGLYFDFVDCFKYLTNRSNTDYTSASHWTGGLTGARAPHVAIVASFYNELVQGLFPDAEFSAAATPALKNGVGRSTGTPESILHALYTQWPSIAILVVGPQSNQSCFGVGDFGTMAEIRAALATDTNYYNITTPGGAKYDANKGRFIVLSDIPAVNAVIDPDANALLDQTLLHPMASAHAVIAAAVLPTFSALSI